MKLRESGRWPANVGLAGLSTAVAPERGNYPASAWLESAPATAGAVGIVVISPRPLAP